MVTVIAKIDLKERKESQVSPLLISNITVKLQSSEQHGTSIKADLQTTGKNKEARSKPPCTQPIYCQQGYQGH